MNTSFKGDFYYIIQDIHSSTTNYVYQNDGNQHVLSDYVQNAYTERHPICGLLDWLNGFIRPASYAPCSSECLHDGRR